MKLAPEKDEKFSYVVLHKTASGPDRACHPAARRVDVSQLLEEESDADDSDGSAPDVEDADAAAADGAGEWAKIVRPPLLAAKHVILDVCTPQGTMERRVPSKGKLKHVPGAYRAARKASWGGHWPNWLSRPKRRMKPDHPAEDN